MSRRNRAAKLAILLGCVLSVGLDQAKAGSPQDIGAISAPAVPLQLAVAGTPGSVQVVSIAQRGTLSDATINGAVDAAVASGGTAVPGRGFQIGLRRVLRGATVVQQSFGPGWGFPMSVTALPLDAVRAVMGRAIAGTVGPGFLVMGKTTADMRGAKAGDQVELISASGAIATFWIGRVVPDDEIGGTEILMTTDVATALGITTNTRVLIFGNFDRQILDYLLTVVGLLGNPRVQVWHSWDAPTADGVMSLLQTKQVMGEFDLYYAGLVSGSVWVERNEGWSQTNLPAVRYEYPTGIVARCHNVIHSDLVAALAEVAGLATLYPELVNINPNPASQSTGLDIANTNSSGGCATPHTARLSRTGISTGIVSRHSWGMALDTSTAANCQGCIPVMDCRIVRIFRKHNFAWGGSFLTPDGMHFEWVGERRDLVQNPKSPCPNLTPPAVQSVNPPPRRSDLSRLFADDGWAGE